MGKREDFEKDLLKLFKKYGVTIFSCGCCGSPSVAVKGVGVYDFLQVKKNEDGKLELSYDDFVEEK